MIKNILAVATLLSMLFVNGQSDLSCGTVPDKEAIAALKNLNLSRFRVAGDAQYVLAITAHVIRSSSGGGGLDSAALYQAVEGMNESYRGSGLSFYIDGPIDYVDNDDYVSFDSSQELAITSANNVPGTINIYFFSSLTSGEARLCGYAYFPNSGRDHIMMANSCTTNGSTLAHEVGHYLALYHTHGKTNNGTTDERVDGSNCTETGDDVCDTPADPNLSGKVNPDLCTYIGSGTDENGDFFVPDARNLMSYSNSACRILFTQGQKDRMRSAYLSFKTYLKKKEVFADFGVTSGKACEGNAVAFANNSIGGVSYFWEFEEGTPATSTEQNPTVTFEQEGYRTVTLTVSDGDQSSVVTDSIMVFSNLVAAGSSLEGGFEVADQEVRLFNPDRDLGWAVTDTLAFEGERAVRINFYKNKNRNSEDFLILPPISTVDDKYYELRFHYAYAGYDSTFVDSLEMVYRSNCGPWVSIWKRGGKELQTTDYLRREFYPKRADWKVAKAEFEVPEDASEIEVAIKGINGFGNSLYLDAYKLLPNDPTFRISTVEVTDASCPGLEDGFVEVLVEGEGPFEYSIDNSEFGSSGLFEDLPEGEYDLFVRSVQTGFVESEPFVIRSQSVYPTQPTLTKVDNRLQAGASLLPGQFLVWYKDGEVLVDQDRSSITDPGEGTFEVAVSNGICESLSESIVIQVLSIEDASELKIYPNPVADELSIELSPASASKVVRMVLSNTLGQKVYEINGFNDLLDLNRVSPGIYFLRLEFPGGSVSKKIIKRQ